MARIIVSTDPVGEPRNKSVLLDEEFDAAHLGDEHAAMQLLDRMDMAIRDANARRAFAPTSYAEVPRA